MPAAERRYSTRRDTLPGALYDRSYGCRSTDDERARSDPRVPNTTASLEHEGFPNLVTFSPAINDFMKKSKKVSQINPKSAIEASRVNPSIDEGVVALDHHEPSALEALHTCPTLDDVIEYDS
jgi:hypothetical protein